MRHLRTLTALLTALAVVVTACGEDDPGHTGAPETLTILAHDSFANAVDDETFASFTEVSGIEVEVLGGGDAGSVVNQAVLSADNPIADVLFGIDDTFLSRALDEEIFVEHVSPLLDSVEDGLAPSSDLVTPIDFGDVCLNYDKGWFAETGTEVPSSLDQLREPDYAGVLTVEHPATSSPGLSSRISRSRGSGGWYSAGTSIPASSPIRLPALSAPALSRAGYAGRRPPCGPARAACAARRTRTRRPGAWS